MNEGITVKPSTVSHKSKKIVACSKKWKQRWKRKDEFKISFGSRTGRTYVRFGCGTEQRVTTRMTPLQTVVALSCVKLDMPHSVP